MTIHCPECRAEVPFHDAFVRAFCWAGGAIAFRCPLCDAPSHFSPHGHVLEVGFLGASPVLDPVPGETYPITVQTERYGDKLKISYDERTVELPSAHKHLLRALA